MTTKKPDTTPPPEEQKLAMASLPQEEHEDESAMGTAKGIEEAVMGFLGEFQHPHLRGKYDQRLVSVARTQIELGFMALHKAIALAEPEQAEGKE